MEPIKNYYDDKLISDGWNINGFRSGIVRRKEQFNPIFENQYMLTSEEHKIEILISRPSSYTITKTLVPLLFLGGLANPPKNNKGTNVFVIVYELGLLIKISILCSSDVSIY